MPASCAESVLFRLFRGVRAPASLKQPGRVVVARAHGAQLFRGVRAPASLKRASWPESCPTPRRPLPGRTRPGLIEAPSPGQPPSTAPSPLFRGVRAPASLKLVPLSVRRAQIPVALPGRTRPGLIEARTRSREWSGRPRHSLPGRTRPGLIEASTATRHRPKSSRASSGAYAPRPH